LGPLRSFLILSFNFHLLFLINYNFSFQFSFFSSLLITVL